MKRLPAALTTPLEAKVQRVRLRPNEGSPSVSAEVEAGLPTGALHSPHDVLPGNTGWGLFP